MARVSHPNVVQVYEVGEDQQSHGGRVFIAMEPAMPEPWATSPQTGPQAE